MGKTNVTVRDIARACAVGVTTVSRALNNQPGVSPETRERILAVAKQLNYAPNKHARYLRVNQSRLIILVVKGSNNPFFNELLDQFDKQIKANGYQLFILRVMNNEDEAILTANWLNTTRVAGVILLGGWFSHPAEAFKCFDVPFILCTLPYLQHLTYDEYSAIATDDAQGIHDMVSHLHQLGHRQIAFLGADRYDTSIGAIRSNAFRKALEHYDIPVNKELIIHSTSLLSPCSYAAGTAMTQTLINKQVPFTAIVAMTDTLALAAMRKLQDHGVHVPDDVSVVGFDDTEYAQYAYPRLTTVAQPQIALVNETCQALFNEIAGATKTHKLLPGKLHIRESTAPV